MKHIPLSLILVLVTIVAVGTTYAHAQDRQRDPAEPVSLRDLIRHPDEYDGRRIEVTGRLDETPMPAIYTLSAGNRQVYVFTDPEQVPRDGIGKANLSLTGTIHEVTRSAFNATFGLGLSRREGTNIFPLIVIVADRVGEVRDGDGPDEAASQDMPVVSYTGTTARRAARCLSPEEERFLTLINDYRREHGLNALTPAASLNTTAWKHSLDMATRDYFSHRTKSPLPAGLTGRMPQDRMEATGYAFNTATGENIAAGPATAEIVFRQWRRSPEHNEIMLDPRFEVIGIGHVSVDDSRFVDYWTTDFGGHDASAPDC